MPTGRNWLRRRRLLGGGAALAGAWCWPAVPAAADELVDLLGQVLTGKGAAPGIPAKLQGDTIAFANWRFVWPGSFTWKRADPGKTSEFGAVFDQVDVPFGLRLFVRQAERIGPIVLDTPGLTVAGACFNTVMHDQGVYRGWGYARPVGEDLSELRYFESTNGLDWTPRPIQGRFAIDLPKRGWLRGHVFKSDAPNDPMPYKHVEEGVVPTAQVETLLRAHPERVDPKSFRSDVPGIYGLFGAQSADGLDWQALDQPIALQHSDTQTIGYYDPTQRDYVLYTRTWDAPTTTEQQALALPTSWIAAGRHCPALPTSTSCSPASTTSRPTSSRLTSPRARMAPPGRSLPKVPSSAPGPTRPGNAARSSRTPT